MICLKVDDPVDGFAVHGCGGMLGLLYTGLFAKQKFLGPLGYNENSYGLLMGGDGSLLAVQFTGMLFLITLSSIGALLVFLPLRSTGRLRVALTDELMGLDIAKHGGPAYPEWSK